MADDDRQPPQAYDTVALAGVGATTTNQMSPGAFQDLYLTGDQGLLDVAMEEIAPDALHEFLANLPSPNTVAGWPDVGGASPAGVGSQASHTPSTVSVRTPTPSPSPSMQRRQFTQRTLAAAGAGGGDDDDGSGGSRRRTPHGQPDRGQGRRRRGGGPVRHPGLPWSPASNPATPRGSWTSGSPPPRTLGQADLQRRLRMMLQDQEQLAQGREIANVTMTNSIVTSYKQGGPPTVHSSSSRLSP